MSVSHSSLNHYSLHDGLVYNRTMICQSLVWVSELHPGPVQDTGVCMLTTVYIYYRSMEGEGSRKRKRSRRPGRQRFTQPKKHMRLEQMMRGDIPARMMLCPAAYGAAFVVPVFTNFGYNRALILGYLYLPDFWSEVGRADEHPVAVPPFFTGSPRYRGLRCG